MLGMSLPMRWLRWAARQPSDDPMMLPFLAPFQELAKHTHDLQWAWFQECPCPLRPCFPPLHDRQLAFFPPSLRRVLPELPTPFPSEDFKAETFDLQLTLVCANVLALDGVNSVTEVGRRTGHRTARLDHQWHAQAVNFIGVQEARTMEGVYQSAHYRILASGGDGPKAARLGCELWCHASQPLAVSETGQRLFLKDFEFVVCHSDSRRLFAKFTNSHLAFAIVVLHAPCLGKPKGQGHRPIEDVAQWWTNTTALIEQAGLPALQWFLVDANAPLDDSSSHLRGPHGAEHCNATGTLFMDFLEQHALSVPATFAHLHAVPTTTWTHSSGARYRRDYVLTSPAAFALVERSWVQTSYDGTFLHEDHLPVVVSCRGLLSSDCKRPHIRWDEDKLRDPECCRQFQEALITLPLPTWSVATAEHCRIYEINVLQLAQQFFVKDQGKRARPPIAPDTANWILFKRHILDCARAFDCLKDPDIKPLMKELEREVRQRVHDDMQIYYDQLLVRLQEAGDQHDFRTMFRALTRFGSRKIKDPAPRLLPALRTQTGRYATSFTEQQRMWMDQFGRIEAGTLQTWTSLQQQDRPGVGPPFDVQNAAAFPSPWCLQRYLRKIKRGKTPGANGLPPSVLKAGASIFAHQFAALTSKVVAHCHEPLDWKGGALIPIPKGKGSPSDPSNYRSIFLSGFTSKLYHMALREHLNTVWEQGITSLQLGGRKAHGVDLAHHCIQAHSHWVHGRGWPSATIFFDLKAAFYSVLRQSLFDDEDQPIALVAALRRYGVSADDIEDMLQGVRGDHVAEPLDPHFSLAAEGRYDSHALPHQRLGCDLSDPSWNTARRSSW